jgi:hypothetical protein
MSSSTSKKQSLEVRSDEEHVCCELTTDGLLHQGNERIVYKRVSKQHFAKDRASQRIVKEKEKK